MRILPALLLALISTRAFAAGAVDWNAAVLAAVREMPAGGAYAVTSEAGTRLREAVAVEGANLRGRPAGARPSYCSGATYLVLLQVVARAQARGTLRLDAATLAALPPRAARDGQGVWGRWNANGPGTARLFHALHLGRNFTAWQDARPGDFLKIFWRDAVGAKERGHLVVYIGTETRDGEEFVRFWSSNKPGGYGEKTVAKSQIARALFSRLEHPDRLGGVAALPAVDSYLAGLLERESSFAEACRLSGAEP